MALNISSALILRVKRHREEDPLPYIRCLITPSESTKNRRKFAELSVNNNSSVNEVLLKRIRTVDFTADLDSETISAAFTTVSEQNVISGPQGPYSTILVPIGKGKALTNDCIAVDAALIGTKKIEGGIDNGNNNRVKVLDPSTRLMDKGIKSALLTG